MSKVKNFGFFGIKSPSFRLDWLRDSHSVIPTTSMHKCSAGRVSHEEIATNGIQKRIFTLGLLQTYFLSDFLHNV